MFNGFFPARMPGGTGVPEMQGMITVASPTFKQGAVLVLSSGLVDEGGANPTGWVGIAMQDADSAPGFSQANNPTVSTGREQFVTVAKANRNTIFRGKLTNNSSTFITPVQADIGVSYGVTKYTIGGQVIWTVDKAKVSGGGTHRVTVVDIDVINLFVFYKVLEAHLATP